ncbi:MAG: hypothetical protein AABX82_09580 [Nanoarchaeota archaeon]
MVAKTEKGNRAETSLDLFPDFYLANNNCVVAAYPVKAEILRRESSQLAGVPFLFYVGTRSTVAQVNESAQRMAKEVIPGGSAPHYFSGADLDRLLEGTIQKKDILHHSLCSAEAVKWPKQIEVIPGRIVASDKIANWWVPYSFGVGHEGDVKGHTPFRTEVDYSRMVQSVLPDVRAERAYM